jgi:hypothetical protein
MPGTPSKKAAQICAPLSAISENRGGGFVGPADCLGGPHFWTFCPETGPTRYPSRRGVAGAVGIVQNLVAGSRLQKPWYYASEFMAARPGNGCRPGRRAAGVILPPPSSRHQEGSKDSRGDSRARFHSCTPPE